MWEPAYITPGNEMVEQHLPNVDFVFFYLKYDTSQLVLCVFLSGKTHKLYNDVHKIASFH